MENIKVSIIMNMLIVILVIVGTIFMFTGVTFMPAEKLLEASKIEMFKFYTVDSNILMGIISLIFLIYEKKLLKNEIKEIPKKIYILKLVGTSAITLTFATTAFFLAPNYGLYAMYNNTNLFFHLIVPVLAIISYIVFEKHENKYKYAIFGIIPMFIYSIFYTINVLIHLNDGGLTFKYDFYGFLQGNINNIYVVMPSIYIISYLMSIMLILGNKKIRS